MEFDITRHALAAAAAILPHEDPQLLNELIADLQKTYQPQNLDELRQVDELAMSYWRIRRFYEMEVRILSPHYELIPAAEGEETQKLSNPDALLKDMGRLLRYQSGLYRIRDRTFRELERLRAERCAPAQVERTQAAPERMPELSPARTNQPKSPNELPPQLARRWPRDRNGAPMKPNMDQKFWKDYFKEVANCQAA